MQDTLATRAPVFFPSFVYPLLTDVLLFYCRNVLPDLGISAEDQRIVREEFEDTIIHLNTREQTAKRLEAQLKQFFLQVKSGTFDSFEEVVSELVEILCASSGFCLSGRDTAGDVKQKATLTDGKEHGQKKEISPCFSPSVGQKQFRAFKKSPFTASHVIPLFEVILASPEIKMLFGYMATLFWHQLYEFVHMKAVLVNTKTKEALITRLDVTTSLESKGLDNLLFESTVDDRMEHSCWNAVQATRTSLEDQFHEILKNKVLRITCRFPNPIAGHHDTSASLLVSLKVIGDVLDMEIDPHTLVSGEVDESGRILPISCVVEKVLAAQYHLDIQRLFLPADGLLPGSDHRSSRPV